MTLRLRMIVPVLSLLVALAASPVAAQAPHYWSEPQPGALQLIDNADWASAKVVEVELGDHHYTPADLVFERSRPTIVRLKNVGSVAHDLKGDAFFRAIVAKMALSSAGRVVTPYLQSIYIRPRQEMELWFIPVQAGEFPFFCTIGDHQESGMEGTIVIR